MSEQNDEGCADRSVLVQITAEIASAYLSNHSVAVAGVAEVVRAIYGALTTEHTSLPTQAGPQQPAVPIRRSVSHDTISCLECGQKNKLLKRHLRVEHNLTPAEYRAKWGLPAEYPMVAPDYAAARSEIAKGMRFGNRTRTSATVAPAKPAGRGRGRGKSAA
ncbi:MucR family transcriptional regulator [Azospirillum argentinense]|uniref:MucR family transcriptional regulator n=1 Tax=Azospirillum argentinense TaxID=2970906 RepID=A0A5B0KPE8_9PROT|nr:MucR family transcriptional regulator [Azospirillum argentinense]KAA1053771.1 transcriptional regulator [Azospirillum argentinense]